MWERSGQSDGNKLTEQASGTTATNSNASISFHPFQKLIYRHRGKRTGIVRHRVGNDQVPAVNNSTTAIYHIWHVAFALVFVGRKQRLMQPANHARRILPIEQEGAHRVLPH